MQLLFNSTFLFALFFKSTTCCGYVGTMGWFGVYKIARDLLLILLFILLTLCLCFLGHNKPNFIKGFLPELLSLNYDQTIVKVT